MVCEKWLKDRRKRHPELDDIRTYCRIVTDLKLTNDIQKAPDFYPKIESQIPTLNHLAK